MPYASVAELPPAVKKKLGDSPHKLRTWMAAFNAAHDEYADEGRAFATAWAAVGNGSKVVFITSVKDVENQARDEHGRWAPTRILDYRDTRETDFDTGKKIPGSGNMRDCDRCGLGHEVHVDVQGDDNNQYCVGTSCAQATGPVQSQLTSIISSSKRVDSLKNDLARARDYDDKYQQGAAQVAPHFPGHGERTSTNKYGVTSTSLTSKDGLVKTPKYDFDSRGEAEQRVKDAWVDAKLTEKLGSRPAVDVRKATSDLTKAQRKLDTLKATQPTGDQAKALFRFDVKNYDPDEPRDSSGRWGSGDDVEDADGGPIEDLEGNRPTFNADGTLPLYHATSEANARSIASSGRWRSEEGDDIFFSTKPSSDYISGFGDHVVKVNLPPNILHMNDAFRDGEIHFSVDRHDIKPEHVEGFKPIGDWKALFRFDVKGFDPNQARDNGGRWTTADNGVQMPPGWIKANIDDEVAFNRKAAETYGGQTPDQAERVTRMLADRHVMYIKDDTKVEFDNKARVKPSKVTEVLQSMDELNNVYGHRNCTVSTNTNQMPGAKTAYGISRRHGATMMLSPRAVQPAGEKSFKEGAKAGWFGPTAEKAGVTKYTVYHEFGHTKDTSRDTPRDSRTQWALENLPSVSKYSDEDPKRDQSEKYAEAFADWHLSQGKTDQVLSQALADAEGWKKYRNA